MANKLRSFSRSVALLKVHIVFVTKYQHPVITDEIEADIKAWI
ncbi:transposase [Spirulina subsalsa]